jgi:hypothetical protein
MVSALVCHTKGRGFKSPLSRLINNEKHGFDLGPARTRIECLTHASYFFLFLVFQLKKKSVRVRKNRNSSIIWGKNLKSHRAYYIKNLVWIR